LLVIFFLSAFLVFVLFVCIVQHLVRYLNLCCTNNNGHVDILTTDDHCTTSGPLIAGFNRQYHYLQIGGNHHRLQAIQRQPTTLIRNLFQGNISNDLPPLQSKQNSRWPPPLRPAAIRATPTLQGNPPIRASVWSGFR
jgi:hypothetical protein